MIEVVDVTQHYGVRPVLRNINLRIESGDLVSILGPNGMGKTTLLGVIAGVLTPQRGYVTIDGLRRRSSVGDELKIRQRVAYVPDHIWLPTNKTGREFLLGVGRVYGIDDGRLMEHGNRLLELFELSAEGDWPIRSYSNGQKHKIGLCAALISEAPVLLLDEPFSGGLDPAGILALKRILRHLTEQRKATVVMTTPVPELLDELASRLVILRQGEVVAADTLEQLREQTQCDGPLSEVLQRLMHPETLERLDRYFKETT